MEKNNVIKLSQTKETLKQYFQQIIEELENGEINNMPLDTIAIVARTSDNIIHRWYMTNNQYELLGLLDSLKTYITQSNDE